MKVCKCYYPVNNFMHTGIKVCGKCGGKLVAQLTEEEYKKFVLKK
jgi:hypothetical protein